MLWSLLTMSMIIIINVNYILKLNNILSIVMYGWQTHVQYKGLTLYIVYNFNLKHDWHNNIWLVTTPSRCVCCEADGQENCLLFIGSNSKIKTIVSFVLLKMIWLLKLLLNFEWIIIRF